MNSSLPQPTPDPATATPRQQGAALVLILAFIVILLVLLLAFFSRATLQQQISKSSSSFSVVDVFAEGATESIIGDLRQEIGAGSSVTNIVIGTTSNSVYTPVTGLTVEPAISGFKMTNGLQNLVKISSSTNFPISSTNPAYTNFITYPLTNRATTNLTTAAALNGHSISTAEWNKPLFVARLNTNSTNDTTPIQAFSPPSWILVARDGSNPTNWSTKMQWSATSNSTVIGRYAYTIYNEGGVLDANVAGYPNDGVTFNNGTNAINIAYKSAEAFADLTQIGLTPVQISALIGWRNFASAPATGSYPGYLFSQATNYFQMVMGNTNGFLSVTTNMTTDGLTDRMFTSRQQLISFLENADTNSTASIATAMNALQYLSTHTRDINQPSYAPAANRPKVLNVTLGGNSAYSNTPQDNIINPSFLTIRVTNSFTRNDGTTAIVGEPFVKKRFALNRIAWLTYKGPSATLYQSSPNDPEITALLSNGISVSLLTNGTAANIQKYFGLVYTNSAWTYSHNGMNSGTGPIMTLPAIAGLSTPRDPDFFEMLKASIAVGSLGKSTVTSSTAVPAKSQNNGVNIYTPPGYLPNQVPANFRYSIDSSVDNHIIQIGANIINQFHPDSFPRIINFNDGGTYAQLNNGTNIVGVVDLPYLSYIYNGVLRSSAGGNFVQVPVVWNVYDPNGVRPPASLTPTNFQVTVTSDDPANLLGNPTKVWIAASGTYVSSTTTNTVFSYNASPNPIPSSTAGLVISDSIQFSATNNNANAFREPTWLIRTKPFYTGQPGVSVTHALSANNITCIDSNTISGIVDPVGQSYSPLVLGTFPLAFKYNNTTVTSTIANMGVGGQTTDNRVYYTYSLQYSTNKGSSWITYDAKYGRVSSGQFNFYVLKTQLVTNLGIVSTNYIDTFTPSIGQCPDVHQHWIWGAALDPRSARFGLFTGGNGQTVAFNEFPAAPSVPLLAPTLVSWIDPANGISLPLRPDQASGHFVYNVDTNDPFLQTLSQWPPSGQWPIAFPAYLCNDVPMTDVPYPRNSAGWAENLVIFGGPSWTFGFPFGMVVQNNVSTPFYFGRFTPEPNVPQTEQAAFYADADGVVRRGSDPYVQTGILTNVGPGTVTASASTPVGQPEAACMSNPPYIDPYTNPVNIANFPVALPPPISSSQIVPYTNSPFSQSQSRPLFLHRPFRSVAELGYVFRDLPFKNIDFFTPESGDTALLDTFCINDTSDPNGLVAGKVDLNTKATNVIAAILSGAYIDDPKVTNMTIGTLATNLATNIAAAFVNRTSVTNNATNGGFLINIGDLVGHYVSQSRIPSATGWTTSTNYIDGKFSYSGFSGIFTNNYKTTNYTDLASAYNNALSTNSTYATYLPSMINIQRFHEAPIRALSSAGQTRVWNLMIDLVAQTGRYPTSASSADNFSIDGEQHYWVHLSIDRMTGQVIDKQIEVVKQ